MDNRQKFRALKLDPNKIAIHDKAMRGENLSDQELRMLNMEAPSDVKTGIAPLPQAISDRELLEKKMKDQAEIDAYNAYSAANPLQRVDPDSEKARLAEAVMQRAKENQRRAMEEAPIQEVPNEQDLAKQYWADKNARIEQMLRAKGLK